jgi:7,8-dihydropterin-6-yl-methyl-4-(beta-D-ribofuranosyl)aminobenzene 5'-phosphate synthase
MSKIQSIIEESESSLLNETAQGKTRITVLVENNTDNSKTELKASHGLSLYVENNNLTFLLDLGDKKIFHQNAKKLNIEIDNIDFVFISHGHYDHGGGLAHFLKSNQKAKIYLKPKAIKEKHFSRKNSIYRDRSISCSLLNEHSERFVFVERKTEIYKGIFMIPKIIQRFSLPQGNNSLFKESLGKMLPDDFDHEQILIIQDRKGLIVFSGCNHNGILNTMETVKHYFKNEPIKAVIGGFHLYNPTLKAMAETTDEIKSIGLKLREYPVAKYITGHCTGIEAYSILKPILDKRLYHMATGMSITL